jgi:pyruvate-ferredoxin/flavodoxin oxidoreductase
MNNAAVDAALAHLHEVPVPTTASSEIELPPPVPAEAPDFVQNVTATIMAGKGDTLPVSALPADGTYPLSTTRWEKRNLAQEIPVWEPDICIQCGKCVMVCPHAVIRAKVVPDVELKNAPAGFKTSEATWREYPDQLYTLQVAAEDCTGCRLCVEVCPAKDKSQVGRKAINMAPRRTRRDQERRYWDFFLELPEILPNGADSGPRFTKTKDVQLLDPLFEFSGACAGCGETPYLSLLTRLFGDRALIANATGCSSIYGGNLPTTPWATNREGRGPAWSNSLFEDNAEFGLGMRLALDKQAEYAAELLKREPDLDVELVQSILSADQNSHAGIRKQREAVASLKDLLEDRGDAASRDLLSLADSLVRKSVWIVGGDGWAYDIGYGGLDHVLASGRNINILVLDTEVYSNTGGQASKATALGAVAKFAAGGKPTPKKDLGLLAMGYGYVYVAQVAMGANENQTIRAFLEAEAYDGPSIIIAYSHCIAHGIDMARGMNQQKLATDSGYWPLYRFSPELMADDKSPLQLDSKPPKIPFRDYAYNETRYRVLQQTNPDSAARYLKEAQESVDRRWRKYQQLAKAPGVNGSEQGESAVPDAGVRPAAPSSPGGAKPVRPASPGSKRPPGFD